MSVTFTVVGRRTNYDDPTQYVNTSAGVAFKILRRFDLGSHDTTYGECSASKVHAECVRVLKDSIPLDELVRHRINELLALSASCMPGAIIRWS